MTSLILTNTIMKIVKTKDVKTPERGTPLSAGLDFFVPNDFKARWLTSGDSVNIASGIYAKIPDGHALIALNKSGIALTKNLQVGACVIDEDYQGEIHLHVTNIGFQPSLISPGEKLVQFLLVPVRYEGVEVIKHLNDLYPEESQRKDGNFGHTNYAKK